MVGTIEKVSFGTVGRVCQASFGVLGNAIRGVGYGLKSVNANLLAEPFPAVRDGLCEIGGFFIEKYIQNHCR